MSQTKNVLLLSWSKQTNFFTSWFSNYISEIFQDYEKMDPISTLFEFSFNKLFLVLMSIFLKSFHG